MLLFRMRIRTILYVVIVKKGGDMSKYFAKKKLIEGRKKYIFLSVLFIVASVSGILVKQEPTSATVGDISEYSALTAGTTPYFLTNGPDGRVWYSGYSKPVVGAVSMSGVVQEYTSPKASQGREIITAPDGNLWYGVGGNPGGIAKMTPAGVGTYYNLGLNNSAFNLTVGPDGAIWFTNSLSIGRITTSGSVTWYPLPGGLVYGSGLMGITAGPDGNLWFTVRGNTTANSSKIGKLTTSGVFTIYSIPSASAYPWDITTGPDGNLWFTESGYANKIGKITTSGVITEYTIPTFDAQPYGIVTGPDGNLWFTESNQIKIGKVTTSGVFTEYTLLAGMGGPKDIILGSDGALWFVAQNKIGRMVGIMKDQEISFTSSAPADAVIDGPTYTPSATSTSNLSVAVTVDASSFGVCSISSGIVSFLQVGTCTLNANQGGSADYNPAVQVQQSFSVAPIESDTSIDLACPSTTLINNNVTCTILVKNDGAATAKEVVLNLLYSSSLTNVTLSDGGQVAGQSATWTSSSLAAGASTTLTLSATAATASRASISISLLQTNPEVDITNNVVDAKIKIQ